MNKADRRRWRAAAGMDDLGELVIAWLHGEVTETPSHCAEPDPETIPLIPALTIVNRGGLVTENSQLAEDSWGGYVTGFATDATTARIRAAVSRAGLTMTACRAGEHGARHWHCPRRAVLSLWTGACPAAAKVLNDCWFMTVEDLRPARNDLLWGTLAAAIGQRKRT